LNFYDLIIDFQGLLKSAWVARLARGARRIGPSFHREGARLLYSAVAGPRNKQRHAVEENLDVVRFLQLPLGAPKFPAAFPLRLVGEPAPRVALVPFSRWPSKNWPPAAFVEVGRELQEQLNATLFILGSETETVGCARITAELSAGGGSLAGLGPAAGGGKGRVINLAGQTGLPQLGGVLQAMNLVIANDSGPMHLAVAAGTPVLAIFGPTDPLRTGPYGSKHRVIAGKLKCQPCFAGKCRFQDEACLRAVTPKMVVAAAMEMLLGQNVRPVA
jgi:ADP-heptose:LPS heptosyltransferase